MEQIVTVGRRKRAVARVFVRPATEGSILINKRDVANYFPSFHIRDRVFDPFNTLSLNVSAYDVRINVNGGGIRGQVEAIRLGLSRALVEMNEENRGPLKKAGFLTRDARKVERKKYGKKKARKSTQFSKR